MNKKDKVYFAIFDEYLEEVPNKEGCYYITDDVLTKFIYQIRHLEFMKEFSDQNIRKLNRKVKHYYTLAHTYKVELGRCRRKLTRIYEKIYYSAFANYALGLSDKRAKEIVDIFKNL